MNDSNKGSSEPSAACQCEACRNSDEEIAIGLALVNTSEMTCNMLSLLEGRQFTAEDMTLQIVRCASHRIRTIEAELTLEATKALSMGAHLERARDELADALVRVSNARADLADMGDKKTEVEISSDVVKWRIKTMRNSINGLRAELASVRAELASAKASAEG